MIEFRKNSSFFIKFGDNLLGQIFKPSTHDVPIMLEGQKIGRSGLHMKVGHTPERLLSVVYHRST